MKREPAGTFYPREKRLPKCQPSQPPPTQPKKYDLGIPDVARHYNLSTRRVLRYLAEGRLKGYRVGPKLIRFNADEVERALVGDR